jgi:hypothetical protein
MASAVVKDSEHHTVLKGKEQEKKRKLNEEKDISLVNLKRMVEKNKAEKIQKSLHLLDFPKANNHIHFISDKSELKSSKLTIKPDNER